MNDYQIIQDIGRSKHAMVYKGRKKKTIQFFALKCVDKSQKHKIMREVRFLHRLQTPYAVHFYEWFETANHLWLILELCPGNRLLDLLQADLKLPEQSVNTLALNLLAALQFLHSNGIVFNNLKPSTVLIDGSGLLKLGDFSLAMHTNTYNGPESEESKRCKRGTPSYMAPELFRPDGVSSFSSDLWSLGCIMYELASGRPPVLKSNFKALVTAIITDPYLPIASCSEVFNGLCKALLAKGLLDRPDWETVRLHPFWQHQLPYAEMPADPALEEFCEVLMAERREMMGDDTKMAGSGDGAHSPQRTAASRAADPVRSSGVDLIRLSQQVLQNRERNSLGSYRGQMGGQASTGNERQRDLELAGPDDEVDFEPDDVYAAHNRDDVDRDDIAGDPGAHAVGEVRGDGDDDEEYRDYDDAEYDAANQSLQAGEESGTSEAARILPFGMPPFDSKHLSAPVEQAAGKGRGCEQDQEAAAEADHIFGSADLAPGGAADVLMSSGKDGSRHVKGRPISAPISSAAGRGSVLSGVQHQVHTADARSAGHAGGPGTSGDGFMGRPITAFAAVGQQGAHRGCAASVGEMLFCVSDLQVRPIVGNKKIENVPPSNYDASTLPFEHLQPADLEAMAAEELDKFLIGVHRGLGGKTAVSAKVMMLSYVEHLALSPTVADLVLNSELGLLMVRILRETKSVPLRAKVAQSLGALIRNAAFISPDLQQGGALVALAGGVRDRDPKVRRRSMAALGELCYYIASQGEPETADGVEGLGCEAEADEWSLPAATLSVLLRALAKGEDDIVQHYAAQALDNLCTQLTAEASSSTAARLAPLRSFDNVSSLFSLVGATKVEALRGTAASALSRLVRFQPPLAAQLVDKVGLTAIVELLAHDNARVQQAFINLLNVVLVSPTQRTLKALSEHEPKLLTAVLALLDHGTSVLVRAKAVVTFRVLASISPHWLAAACDKKLLSTLERLQRDKDAYLKGAIEALVQDVALLLPQVVTSMSKELSNVRAAAGKGKSTLPGDALKPLKPPLSLLPLLLHVVTSPSVRPVAVCGGTIRALAECITVAEVSLQPFAGSVEFRRILHLVVEALAQQNALLLHHHEAVISHLLPSLVQAALRDDDAVSGPTLSAAPPPSTAAGGSGGGSGGSSHGTGTTRYLCLRAVASILGALMADHSVYDPSAVPGSGNHREEHAAVSTKMVHELLVRQLLPKYTTLLSDKDHSLPVPQCAVKIAALVMHHNPAFAVVLQRLRLVGTFMSFLAPESPQLSVHAVCVVRAIMQAAEGAAPGPGTDDQGQGEGADGLHHHRLSHRFAALVKHMAVLEAEDLYEPTLDVVSTVLYQTVSCLQDVDAPDGLHATWLARAEPFVAVAPSLCSLCHSQEEQTCETASQCLLLLSHLFPAHVLSPGPAASHVSEALRIEGATVRKRLLKTLLWVVNSGDFHAVADAVVQVEEAVAELAGEEGLVGELANDLLAAIQQASGASPPFAHDHDDPDAHRPLQDAALQDSALDEYDAEDFDDES